MLLLLPTLRAVGNPAGEAPLFEVLKAGVVVGKLAVEIIDCVPQIFRNCLSAVHDIDRLAKPERDVKG